MKIACLITFCLFLSTNLFASCCSSTSTGGILRLLPHERALIEMSTGVRYHYGSFNQDAAMALGHHAGLPYLIFEEELLATTRLVDFFEPFVRLPVRVQRSDERVGAGLSDIAFGARLPLFKDNYFKGFPALTLIETVRIPSGASIKTDGALNNENALGSGTWLFTTGLFLEKINSGLSYGLGYSLAFEPAHLRNTSPQPGLIHTLSLSLGFMPNDSGTLILSLAPIFHSSVKVKNRVLSDTDRRKLSLSCGYSLNLHSHIKVHGSLGADLPIGGLGKNFNSELFLRLGMRIGIF